jgi:uncharacterized membrane protein (UPF0182 family)
VKKPFYMNRYLWVAVGSLAVGLMVLGRLSGLLVDWLWMGEVGYAGVFWKILSVKAVLFLAAFASSSRPSPLSSPMPGSISASS